MKRAREFCPPHNFVDFGTGPCVTCRAMPGSDATPSNVGHDGETRSEPVTPKAQHPSGDVERVVRAAQILQAGVKAVGGHLVVRDEDVLALLNALAALRVAPAASPPARGHCAVCYFTPACYEPCRLCGHPGDSPPAAPRHVCGLTGFGAIGDVCEACRTPPPAPGPGR